MTVFATAPMFVFLRKAACLTKNMIFCQTSAIDNSNTESNVKQRIECEKSQSKALAILGIIDSFNKDLKFTYLFRSIHGCRTKKLKILKILRQKKYLFFKE